MKTTIYPAMLAACVLASVWTAAAQEELTPQQQIHESAKAFINTFNRGDAQGLAEFWTEDGDYIDEAGQKFVGREAIQNEYAGFFAENPGVKITLAVDSIRLLNDDIAIEDGRASLAPMPKGPPAESRYTVVHVKLNGQWLMSSVRDTRIDIPSSHARLADLDFLVGTWEAEHEGAEVELVCNWIANKNFLERMYTVTENKHPLSSTKEIIGWDPAAGVIKSWTFSSDGGNALGVWTPHDTGWMIETSGVLLDGTPTSAVYVLSHVDANAMAWKSVRRSRGNVELPDSNELVLKRKPADK